MNKSFYLLIVAVFVSIFAFTSCEETKEVDTSVVWRDANNKFIDSIATVARANADGKWKVMKAWNLPPDIGTLNPSLNPSFDVQQYIYAKVIKEGIGEDAPALYTDTVYVRYQGRYYNGKIFDSTYPTNDITPETSKVYPGVASNFVVGFSTALQHMSSGDRWEVYIPWMLGYGAAGKGSIPGYSDLVFDLDLVKIVTPEGKERAKR